MSRRNITFAPQAWDDFNNWAVTNLAIADKIRDLIKDISRTPFTGIGKPEALKGNFKGYWSRRINQEHRLIYTIKEESIVIAYCKGHYNDK